MRTAKREQLRALVGVLVDTTRQTSVMNEGWGPFCKARNKATGIRCQFAICNAKENNVIVVVVVVVIALLLVVIPPQARGSRRPGPALRLQAEPLYKVSHNRAHKTAEITARHRGRGDRGGVGGRRSKTS